MMIKKNKYKQVHKREKIHMLVTYGRPCIIIPEVVITIQLAK